MFDALLQAWADVFTLTSIVFLVAGVLMGLVLGAIPGLGGLIGLTILISFTNGLSTVPALAMMLGLAAVTTTSDSIPAILFGIPGTAAAQATILDGFPMARRGEAARALGASFSASAIGGTFGAIVLFVSIPILRPLVLQFGSPELFLLAMLGISMIAVLSHGAVVKGIVGGGIGLLLTTIGQDSLTGIFRYVYGQTYLWDGLPIVAVSLGIFAIPELVDLVVEGGSVATTDASAGKIGGDRGKWEGVLDTLRNWFLVIRSSNLGVFVGFIPGLGATVVDWLAYGLAKQLSKDSGKFGTGDVRGVIAVDAATNSKEGGALVTTIAFGIPGSVTMALLLAAFQIHNLVPGPLMLTKQLSVTLTLVWTLVLANLIGAGICFLLVSQIARVSMVRIHRLFPLLMTVIFLGAYQGRQDFGDLMTLVVFGALGWSMKRAGWPRPPLILGFILGKTIQDRLFLSISRYGATWILHPLPLFLALLSVASVSYGIVGQLRGGGGTGTSWRWKVRVSPRLLVTLFFLLLDLVFLVGAAGWPYRARLFPWTMAFPVLGFLAWQLLNDLFAWPRATPEHGQAQPRIADLQPLLSMKGRDVARRGGEAFAWIFGLLFGVWLVGFPPTIALFCFSYLMFRSHEKWWVALSTTAVLMAILYGFFDQVLHVSWPEGLLS
jgi:putative tricarboxylic transport membrane protein